MPDPETRNLQTVGSTLMILDKNFDKIVILVNNAIYSIT